MFGLFKKKDEVSAVDAAVAKEKLFWAEKLSAKDHEIAQLKLELSKVQTDLKVAQETVSVRLNQVERFVSSLETRVKDPLSYYERSFMAGALAYGRSWLAALKGEPNSPEHTPAKVLKDLKDQFLKGDQSWLKY